MLSIMKQFINVLYRRILYKIPLKLLLVILAIVSVFIACTEADYLDWLTYIWNISNTDTNSVYTTTFWTIWYPDQTSLFCIHVNDDNNDTLYTLSVWATNNIRLRRADFWCFYYSAWSQTATIVISNSNWNWWVAFDFDIYKLSTDFSITSWNPWYTSLQCQTEYNLIPISSVDQNYCTTNNLCPSNGWVCSSLTGVSTLYINDILHVWSPFIYMNIPEEIGWDYAYTQWGTNMFIDIEWYNVDYDKMHEILEVQNYKPTSEDFSQVVSNLTPYVKILVFVLFVFIIWKWIKGGFKSKLK